MLAHTLSPRGALATASENTLVKSAQPQQSAAARRSVLVE